MVQALKSSQESVTARNMEQKFTQPEAVTVTE